MLNDLITSCIDLSGPVALSAKPVMRKQSNGNFTGFVRTTYNNGDVIESVFVENARTPDEVAEIFRNRIA